MVLLKPRCSDDSNRLAVQNTKDKEFKQNSGFIYIKIEIS